MELHEFCTKLPKIELHAHINGSLSHEALKTLNCSNESIQKYQTINRTNLTEVFELFKVAHDATNNSKSVYFATQSVIEDFFKENVIYLELRTTPRIGEDMTKEDYIETVVKAIKDNKNPIIVKLILSIDRRHDLETSTQVLDLIIKMKNKYPDLIKGVDLCGDPTKGQFIEKLFKKAVDSNLKTTLHCAEVVNNDEVMEMLEFGPDRIGHGTFLHPNYGGSQKNWEIYTKKFIPIECCLTSNVSCKTSPNYEGHHVKEWIKDTLPFSLGTDDKGVFCTTLSQEYEKAATFLGLTNNDLWNISYKSVDYTFASHSEREVLKASLINWKNETSYF